VHAIGRTLASVGALFKQIVRTRGRDIMSLYLANYVEHAAHITVGVQRVPQFLRDLASC